LLLISGAERVEKGKPPLLRQEKGTLNRSEGTREVACDV